MTNVVTAGSTVAMSVLLALGIELALLKTTFRLMHRAAEQRKAEMAGDAAKAGGVLWRPSRPIGPPVR